MPTGTNPLLPRPATRWQEQLQKQEVEEAAERAEWALQRAKAVYGEQMTEMQSAIKKARLQWEEEFAKVGRATNRVLRKEAAKMASELRTELTELTDTMKDAKKQANRVFNVLDAEKKRTAAIAIAFVKSRVNRSHTNDSLNDAVEKWLKGGNERRKIEDMWGHITNWNTSNVTDMNNLFYYVRSIGNVTLEWDTRNVTSMVDMFNSAIYFNNGNQPLLWDTRNVTDMNHMFANAERFNQPLPWDTSSVVNMEGMFGDALAFNQPLAWDTRKVTNMKSMFMGAIQFNQPIEFDTSAVTDMSGMFQEANVFDQTLDFDTGNVRNMDQMFEDAYRFNNGNIPLSWDTLKVTTMRAMFQNAYVFNQPLNFFTKGVQNMNGVFYNAMAFNNGNKLLLWDTRNVTDMSYMFARAASFNQPLFWDTKNVKDMAYMFLGAVAFGHRLAWDTNEVVWDPNAWMFDRQARLNRTEEEKNADIHATNERRADWDSFYTTGGAGEEDSDLHRRLYDVSGDIQRTKVICNRLRERWDARYGYDVLMRIQQSLVEANNASSDDEAARILQKPILASNAYTRPYFALDESIFTTNEIGRMKSSKILGHFISAVGAVYMKHAHNRTSEIANRISDLWEMLMATLLNWEVPKKEAMKPEVLSRTKRRFIEMKGSSSTDSDTTLIAAVAAAAAERLSKGMLLMHC